MRVVTGKYKGRRFNVPHTFDGHPTTDRAKENIFNVINNYINLNDATCLDLFAGTGSITLELLSRGAQKVIAVEKNRRHAAFIQQCLDTLNDNHAIVICNDAIKYIEQTKQQQLTFDCIFADPPYNSTHADTILDRIFQLQLLKDNGILIIEHGKQHNYTQHIHCIDSRTYGKVNMSIFR